MVDGSGHSSMSKCSIKISIQLELCRAHTPRAAVSTTFTYLLCKVVRMSRKHMVGSVHRRGQQNAVFAMLVDLAKQFEA